MEGKNKFNNFLNEKLVPLGAKISNQPHLKAIRGVFPKSWTNNLII